MGRVLDRIWAGVVETLIRTHCYLGGKNLFRILIPSCTIES